MKHMDSVEEEYVRCINTARTTDEAYEYSVGLKQYRELYKDKAGYGPGKRNT